MPSHPSRPKRPSPSRPRAPGSTRGPPRAPVPAAAAAGPVGADPVISARGLVKRFGAVEAVRGIDVDAYPRDFLGFLGPNGAGKTTLMKMIYCLVEPTAGTLHVFGKEVRADAREHQGAGWESWHRRTTWTPT